MIEMEKILAHDRRMAAVHEAGHLTVAHMKQVTNARASIYRHEDAGDPMEMKTYGGQVIGSHLPPSAYVAGQAAEALDEDPNVAADQLIEYGQRDLMATSPTDFLGIPQEYEPLYEAVVEALALLLRCGQPVLRVGRSGAV